MVSILIKTLLKHWNLNYQDNFMLKLDGKTSFQLDTV